jgi:hypothetical protein
MCADCLSAASSLPPFAVQAYVTVCLGLKFAPVAVTVIGSPSVTSVGEADESAAGQLLG